MTTVKADTRQVVIVDACSTFHFYKEIMRPHKKLKSYILTLSQTWFFTFSSFFIHSELQKNTVMCQNLVLAAECMLTDGALGTRIMYTGTLRRRRKQFHAKHHVFAVSHSGTDACFQVLPSQEILMYPQIPYNSSIQSSRASVK
jgi:hypothetical protein